MTTAAATNAPTARRGREEVVGGLIPPNAFGNVLIAKHVG
jgi:hypothetical protein